MTWKGKWPGTYAVNCDTCGFRFPSNKLKRRWDGAMVCAEDWETRHPQTLIKVRGETAVPDYTRHNSDNMLLSCDIVTSSAYVSLAAVGCAQVGNVQYTYEFLEGLVTNGHE